MFTARSIDDNAWITSIGPEWRGREEVLREWARADRMVCPGCGQFLRFRFRLDDQGAAKRRPHFAHRAKSDCPLEHQSAEVMEAKALLYERLQREFPGDVVMDWPLEIVGWTRPVDVYVKTVRMRPLAYWVFDRGVRDRWDFVHLVRYPREGFACQVVWTGGTMTFHQGGELILSPTQRDLLWREPDSERFDAGDRLTFLDTRSGDLALYRGLALSHAPNLYQWRARREGPLSSALVEPNTGEILFQEDLDEQVAAREARRRRAEEERRRREEEQSRQLELRRLAQRVNVPQSQPKGVPARPVANDDARAPMTPPVQSVRSPAAPVPSPWSIFGEPLRCEECGMMTSDWVSGQRASGTCVCRACMAKREKG